MLKLLRSLTVALIKLIGFDREKRDIGIEEAFERGLRVHVLEHPLRGADSYLFLVCPDHTADQGIARYIPAITEKFESNCVDGVWARVV